MNREKIILDIKKLKDEQAALKKEENRLWELLNINSPGNEVYDNVILKVTETSRFNADTARKNLDEDTLERISKMTPDSNLAKGFLDEDTYKITCCNQSFTKTISIVKD